MESKTDISIISPIYNEQENIRNFVSAVYSTMSSQNCNWELILVDDGSTDESRSLLKSLAKDHHNLRVLLLSKNFGQTPAIQAGFDHAKGNVIVTLDSDLQNDPKDIPLLVNKLKNENLDLVVGWRKDRKDNFFIVQFVQSPSDIFNDIGHVPLPPYIKRHDEEIDKERYATVYENKDFQNSVAAPTAGLHFDNELLQKIKNIGVETLSINLSVGAGTFQPVKTENIKDHKIHKEFVEVSDEIVDKVKQAKNNGKKIFAVGTTTLRAIETAFIEEKGYKDFTDLFIYPGFKFKAVDMLITNFHLPKSSLLMLVSAFIGFENVKKIYDVAVQEKYRFLSYGDAMLLRKNEI